MNTDLIQRKPREDAWLWLVKVVLGLFIVIVLGIHYVINHITAPGGLLSYNDVLGYYTNPLIVIMEFLFLVFAVTHSLIGLRSILMDLNLSIKIQNMLDRVLVGVGLVAIVYGTWLLIVLSARTTG